MATTNNFSDTEYAIQNEAERFAWAAYFIFIILSSSVGDTLIIIATFNKNAFKMNSFIVTIIQHVAIVDLGVTLFDALPTLISLWANSWILGYNLCSITVYIAYYLIPTGMYMIAILTTTKFLLLRYPLRASSFSKNRGHQICIAAWVFCFTLPAIMFALDKDDVCFDYRSYNCGYKFKNEKWNYLMPINAAISTFAPNIIIISTTIPTLKYLARARKAARRVQGSIPRKGAVTVAITAVVFTLSNLPFVGHKIAETFMSSDNILSMRWFYIELYRFVTSLLFVNTVANFYIYFATMKSFRRFLKFAAQTSAPSLSLKTSSVSPTGTY